MEPDRKALQIFNHFKKNDPIHSNHVLSVRSYIGQILDDFPMLPGDYTMEYKHEWINYSSYWYAVLEKSMFIIV